MQTMEELKDVYQHFLLYYGLDIPKMKMSQTKKKSESEKEDGEADPEPEIEPTDTIKHATRKTGYNICQEKKIGRCDGRQIYRSRVLDVHVHNTVHEFHV